MMERKNILNLLEKLQQIIKNLEKVYLPIIYIIILIYLI